MSFPYEKLEFFRRSRIQFIRGRAALIEKYSTKRRTAPGFLVARPVTTISPAIRAICLPSPN